MSIVRRNGEEKVLRKKMFGGEGEAEMHVILDGEAEMFGKGRVFNRVVLAPGAEVAWHVHHGTANATTSSRARAATATTARSSPCAPAT